jgi:hypothetical protein
MQNIFYENSFGTGAMPKLERFICNAIIEPLGIAIDLNEEEQIVIGDNKHKSNKICNMFSSGNYPYIFLAESM